MFHRHDNGVARDAGYPKSLFALVGESAAGGRNGMTAAQPPKLATFLIERLAGGEPALLSDLQEEYRSGRSRSWYWREALSAIGWSLIGVIRRHPVKFLR